MLWYGDRPCSLGCRVVGGDSSCLGFREPHGVVLLTWIPLGCWQSLWCVRRRGGWESWGWEGRDGSQLLCCRACRGRFGQVHRCTDKSTGLLLAAKVIKVKNAKDRVRRLPRAAGLGPCSGLPHFFLSPWAPLAWTRPS